MFEARSPFERLRELLSGIEPAMSPIDLAVGNPRHAPPPFVADVVAANVAGFGPYPTIAGTADLQDAMHGWLDRRFALGGLLRDKGAVLPTSGSREGLFFAAFTARDVLAKADPVILFANPFYQTYPASAHGIAAHAVPLAAADRPGAVLPDFDAISPATLDRAIAYFIASPSNPVGHNCTMADWFHLFDLAERHDFFICADECYSELYRAQCGPPPGVLEAARERPTALERLFVFNSLSKRSNLAGLRFGLVAGGATPMAAMRQFRNQAAATVPTPLQAVAAAAYRDEAHVIENRRLYDEKYVAAQAALGPIFGEVTPRGGFFLWLPVMGDDAAITRALWQEAGVRTVPGSYLAVGTGDGNPGAGFVRLALVSPLADVRDACERLAAFFERRGSHRTLAP
ncbi:MAG: aminotransferase class I/II-fold pyridoxal phosphate-dependent enzyme [Acuticoccus sp.]